MEQLQLSGIYDTVEEHENRRFSIKWSHSRRNALEQCPRRYYYQYYGANLQTAKAEPLKERLHFLKTLSNRHLRTGKILHFVIKSYLNHLRNGEDWPLARVLSWARDIYRGDLEYSRQYQPGDPPDGSKYPPVLLMEFYYGFEDAETLWRESKERLVKALTNFVTSQKFGRFRPGACCKDALLEKDTRIEERDFSATGKVDLAYPENGRFTIVDWKISDTHGSGDSLQLLFYALGMIREFGCAPDDINLYQGCLADSEISEFAVHRDGLRRAKVRIIQDLQKMQALHDYGQNAVAEAFTPCDQERVCALCQFQEVCQRG